jgi:hypothetical protein
MRLCRGDIDLSMDFDEIHDNAKDFAEDKHGKDLWQWPRIRHPIKKQPTFKALC